MKRRGRCLTVAATIRKKGRGYPSREAVARKRKLAGALSRLGHRSLVRRFELTGDANFLRRKQPEDRSEQTRGAIAGRFRSAAERSGGVDNVPDPLMLAVRSDCVTAKVKLAAPVIPRMDTAARVSYYLRRYPESRRRWKRDGTFTVISGVPLSKSGSCPMGRNRLSSDSSVPSNRSRPAARVPKVKRGSGNHWGCRKLSASLVVIKMLFGTWLELQVGCGHQRQHQWPPPFKPHNSRKMVKPD